jgi:hypothetical protein
MASGGGADAAQPADTPAPHSSSEQRYRAFFSYARADARMANALYRYLDGYKVPSALVGMASRFGPVPASLHPVFRDREDLAAGDALSERLRGALADSAALIVLCSPAAARSVWVDQEVRVFLALGRNDRIFPVLAGGEPDAQDSQQECLPPALRGRGLLAADLREMALPDGRVVGDGLDEGRLKLVSGLLGLPLDALRLREAQRRRRRQAALLVACAAFLTVAAAAIVFGLQARQNEREAVRQRDLALANVSRVFLQRAWQHVDSGGQRLATKYGLAARALSPATADEQHALFARLRFHAGHVLQSWRLPARVAALALAPGGGNLATLDELGRLALWAPDAAKPLWQLQQHELAGTALAFAAQGRLLISAGADGQVQLQALTGDPVPRAAGRRTLLHDLPVMRLALDAGSHWLATYAEEMSPGAFHSMLTLWDVNSGRQLWRSLTRAPLLALAVDAERQRVWFLEDGDSLRLRSVSLMTGGPLEERPLIADGQVAVLAPANDLALIAGARGHLVGVRLSDNTRRFERTLVPEEPIVSLDAAGDRLTALTRSGKLYVLDAADGTLLGQAQGQLWRGHQVAIAADGRSAGAAGEPGILQTWRAGRRLAAWPSTGRAVLAANADERLLVVAGADRVEWRELPSGRLLARQAVAARAGAPAALMFDEGPGVRSMHLAWTGGGMQTAKPGDSGQPLAPEAPPRGTSFAAEVALGPRNLSAVVLAGRALRIAVHGLPTALELRADTGAHVGFLGISRDGQRLAAATHDGDIFVWSLRDGRLLLNRPGPEPGFKFGMMKLDGGPVRQLAFDASGRLLAYVLGGALNLLDIDRDRIVAAMPVPANAGDAVAFSADGRWVAAGGAGGTFVFDRASTRQIAAFDAAASHLLFVGPLLVSGGVDVIDDSGRRTSVGTQLWDLSTLQASTDELAASLCAALLGPDDAQFTAEEAAADAMITSAWLANGSSGSAPALCPTSGAQR